MTMPDELPPETTPEWTEQDEVDLRDFARFIGPDFTPSAKAAYRFAREIIRLRSEREAQDAEIAKLNAMVNGFRREAESWRDVANSHAERVYAKPTLHSNMTREELDRLVAWSETRCHARGCEKRAEWIYEKRQLNAHGGESVFRYKRCQTHCINGALKLPLKAFVAASAGRSPEKNNV